MKTVTLLGPNHEFYETLKTKLGDRVNFILLRGRLFQRLQGTDNFIQRSYLEVS